jgi:cellobiose epimerase
MRAPTVKEFESTLERHVLDVWFPRSLDLEYGGFLCDFDHAWRPCGPHEKLLEFQARQTWLAAEASQVYPRDERLLQAARLGFCYLRDVMWDKTFGGWFHRLDRFGNPLEAHTKHAHGAACAIAACTAVYEATGETGALNLGREGFEWLERCARDNQHGGYFGFLRRDGTIIRDKSESPLLTETDSINTPIGYKDADVHSDLLETLIYLYKVWPSPKVEERLSEVVTMLCQRMASPSGALHYFCHADWTPLPHLVRFGVELQTAFRLLGACGLVGDFQEIRETARRLVEHTLRYAWDPKAGGVFFAGPGANPIRIGAQRLVVHAKSWWVQSEALKTLLALSQIDQDNANYIEHFQAQWSYIKRYLIDSRYGGFYQAGLDALRPWHRRLGLRFAPAYLKHKGSDWKDGSHEGRAMIHCISALRDNGSTSRMQGRE